MSELINIDEIIFRQDLYPRFDIDNNTVEQYKLNLEALPPITITTNKILIDGKHRLRAYQLSGRKEINADLLDISEEKEILKEAIRCNAIHGKQLDIKEKKDLARRLFSDMSNGDLAELLAVHLSNIYRWTEDLLADQNAEQEAEIIKLCLKMWTQERVAEKVGVSQPYVNKVISQIRTCESVITPPESLQHYDVWNFQALDKQYGQDYPGRIPGQIIENVLWYWTEPLDVVCDPMVGGGTTIDVCKTMYRRYLGFDINIVHDEAIRHDIKDGWPKLPETYEKADLIFLDPPYFKKKAEEYNLPEEYNTKQGFLNFAQNWVDFSLKALKKNGKVALLISDYVDYDNPKESIFSYEYAHLFNRDFDVLYKISVPLTSQQYQGFHVTRAQENKQLLIIGRELYIFKLRDRADG